MKRRKSRRTACGAKTLGGGADFVEIDEAEAAIAPAREPMGEGVDTVTAIAFENAMISVVQQYDITTASAPEAANYGSGRLRLPIPGQDGPHDHAKRAAFRAAFADDSIELRAAKAERRTHPARTPAGNGFDGFVAAGKFNSDAARTHEGERRVRFGMISDGMAALGDFARKIRKEADVATDQEKCGTSSILIQQIEQRGRDGGVRAVVKSDGHRGAIAGAPNRGAEKLRCGRDRGPGKECTSTEGSAHRFDCRSRVHILQFSHGRRAVASESSANGRDGFTKVTG